MRDVWVEYIFISSIILEKSFSIQCPYSLIYRIIITRWYRLVWLYPGQTSKITECIKDIIDVCNMSPRTLWSYFVNETTEVEWPVYNMQCCHQPNSCVSLIMRNRNIAWFSSSTHKTIFCSIVLPCSNNYNQYIMKHTFPWTLWHVFCFWYTRNVQT